MKKVILMLVAMFTISLNSFADNNESNEVESFEKYDIQVNNRRLASFLDLSEDQIDAVESIITELKNGMSFAFYENGKDSRKKVVANVVNANVKHMSYILNKSQYKKYLTVFNATLVNRGFDLADMKVEE